MLLCVCAVIDHRLRQNLVRTKSCTRGDSRVCHWCSFRILTSSVIYYWADARQHGIYFFHYVRHKLPHRNLFYFKIHQLDSKAGLCPLRPLWQTRKKPFAVTVVYTNEAISLVAMGSKRILIGPRKSHHCQTWLECRSSWNEDLQQKQNWTAKSTNLEENVENRNSFCHQSSPVSWKAWTLPWLLQEL